MYRGAKFLIPLASAYGTYGMMNPAMYVVHCAGAETDQSGKADPAKMCKKKAQAAQYKDKRPELEKCADACRRECKPLKDACISSAQTFLSGLQSVIQTGLNNIEFLQHCAEPELQAVVIASAGLAGVLLAYRRSWGLKILYGLVGSAIAYSVIFPNDAAQISIDLLGNVADLAGKVFTLVVGDRAPYKCPESNRITLDCPKKECKRARKESARKEECEPRKAASGPTVAPQQAARPGDCSRAHGPKKTNYPQNP